MEGPGRSPRDGCAASGSGSAEASAAQQGSAPEEGAPPAAARLRALGGVRREAAPRWASGEMGTPESASPTAPVKPLGIAVSMQTEASWLYEQLCKKSALPEELSRLNILCDLEFREDFVKLFKKSLCTLPSVGLPTLLAYRPQSSRENIQIEIGEDYIPKCEYCGNALKLFPSFENVCLPSPDYKSKFCCERYQELYEFILDERKNHEAAWSNPIAISPHESHGNETERLLAKERAYQRRQERQMAKQLAFLATEPASLPESSSEVETISYLLSREPPCHGSRTLLRGGSAAEPGGEEPSCSVTCCDFALVAGKPVKSEFLEKYYKHGGKFLTILPDRTAQLLNCALDHEPYTPQEWNLAVIVAREAGRFTCLVQEDKPSNAAIQAVFQSTGRSTCYHPNGSVWIHMNIHGGQYLDQAGNRVRMWTWPSIRASPGPPVPLSPIFISLNRHVGVRILGQDKIAVSFLAMGQQAKFNVGTRVQGSDMDRLPQRAPLGEEQLLLLAFRIRIRQLFDKLRGCLTFPSNEQWDKIRPPAYLNSQALKITELCEASDVSEEVQSLVRAIINTQV